ncbi:hypothetical protein HOLleu_20001 [Holothuria leucospilota]|uniref:Secreted protein n=1 Tax=Holothuria leucospilota TaxID=206669 RepID=A0A9Q1C0Y0_HOLLE|nr:hypothetical protein HOLleu_20001 [Holothuria leucospilota]
MGRCLSLCLLLLLLLAILPFPVVRAKKMRGCLKLGFRACGAPMGKRTANQDSGPPNDIRVGELWVAMHTICNYGTLFRIEKIKQRVFLIEQFRCYRRTFKVEYMRFSPR